MGELEHGEETAAQSTLSVESPCDESLPAERELEPAVGIPLRGRDATVLAKLDRSTSLATPETFRETGRDAARSSRRHYELLPVADLAGRRGRHQRQ